MGTTHLWIGRLGAAGIVIASLIVGRAASAQTSINFDNLLDGTSVTGQYASQCATFNGIEVISSGSITPASGSNVLINSSVDHEFTGGPLTVTFTQPQQSVTLNGGYVLLTGSAPSLPGTLTAFDQAGNPLPASNGQVTNTLTVYGGSVANNQFTVSSSQGNIWSVTLDFGSFTYTAIDNLQFNGCSATNPGVQAPVVSGLKVNGQSAGPILDTGAPLTVSASVSGQDLAGTVTVALTYLTAPPGQSPQTLTTTAPLTNGQVNAQAFPNLPVGNYKVTVTAANTEGETAAATMSFFYAIQAFINSEPQGTLEYALQLDNCQIDVFADTGAWGVPKGSDGTKATIFNIPEPLFTEWTQVRTESNNSRYSITWWILGADGTLGCPTGNATPIFPNYPGVKFNPPSIEYLVQDFERGRIYGFLNGPDAGTAHYVPTGFAKAIDAESTYLDPGSNLPATVGSLSLKDPFGINEVGMPMSDPTLDMANSEPVFLFQRFLPPQLCMYPLYVKNTVDPYFPKYPSQADCVNSGGTPNTLEIRAPSIGGLQTLYVERVGGALMDYQSATGKQPQLGDPVPTVWEQYPCTGFPNFNCPVTKFHLKAVSPASQVPMYTSSDQVPNDDGYCGLLPADAWGDFQFVVGGTAGTTTEWSAIPGKGPSSTEPSAADYIDILSEGWIVASRASGGDFPPTHEHMNYSAFDDFIIGTSCVIGACTLGAELEAQENGAWSDWDIYIRPLALGNITDPNSKYVLNPSGTPANGGVPPFWNLLAGQADPAIDGLDHAPPMGQFDIEYEDDWQHRVDSIPGFHSPQAGHLLVVNGRWMIDCGHPPVHSEIHPPSMLIDIANASLPVDPTTGKPAMAGADPNVTRAQVWFNQLYTGGAVTTQIWAPPRPEPDAVLDAFVVTYLEPNQPQSNPIPAGGAVTLPFSPNPFISPNSGSAVTATLGETGLTLSASGPSGSHQVQDTGQVMNPQDNAGYGAGTVSDYMGAWYVGWISPPENPCIAGSCI